MKIKFKVIVSMISVILAFISLTTSTYAWFTMNKTATLTGMEINVVAESSLLVSETGEEGSYKPSIALKDTENNVAETIVPTQYDENMTFYRLTDLGTSEVNDQGKFIPPDGVTLEDNDYYNPTIIDYFNDEFWLLYIGSEDTASIKVSALWSIEPVEAIKYSMHIVITDEDNQLVVDIDMSNEKEEYAVITLENNVSKKFHIYGFISGEDEDCKNVNISTKNQMEATVNFTLAE